MEQYLKDEYGVVESEFVETVDDIKDYISDYSSDLFDCGQGYYQDEATVLMLIDGNYYEVTATAEIESSRQDRGDRLYWVESIESVSWEEIAKPLPKARTEKTYTLSFAGNQEKHFLNFLSENNINII